MLKNYFKIAWRNISRNKVTGFINIAGLSIGMTCVILILFFIQNELSFDKFHKDADRVFQVTLKNNMGGQESWTGNTPPSVGHALASNFPGIESYTRFYKPQDIVVRSEASGSTEKFFTEKNILAVDSNFLQLIDFKMLEGDPATALLNPGSVVITENMAKKSFGDEKPIGKTILMNEDKKPFTVTAVLKNIPSQSSIQFDFLTTIADFPVVKRFNWSWVWQQMTCYVKLRSSTKKDVAGIKELESKFPEMVKIQAAGAFERVGLPFDEFMRKGGQYSLHLLPITDVHLLSGDVSMQWLSNVSDIKYIYIFGSTALFIIILACVNFMNLATARSSKRAKEIGIRKVLGSERKQLVWQFLTEAFLYSCISTIIAVVLVILLLKPFSVLTGESIDTSLLGSLNIGITVAILTILVGLLAGSYPAFYLTSFNPVSVLKGKISNKSGRGNLFIRNGLVVFQFSISTLLIIGTLVVFKQLSFFRNTNLGLNKENVLVISNSNRLGKSEESFRQTISQLPGVSIASITTSIPTGSVFGDRYVPEIDEKEQVAKDISLNSFMVDYDFIPALQVQVLKGRNFSRDFADSASVILNEEAVKQIGWKDPVGKYMRYPGGNNHLFKVIAVVKDFNVESLQTSVTPFALFHSSSRSYDIGSSFIIARIKPGDVSGTVNKVERKWKKFVSGEPFDYNFLDASFDALYRSEKRMGNIFSIFTALSLFIACLGLFGLSAFIAERRIKEIGVRKVLGASVQSIVSLLSKDFLKLTIISAFIAFPIAWWTMNKWLEDFAYRIDIGWTVFLIAGLCTLFVSLLTVSFQAIKAAMANPVASLRSE